MIIFMGHRNWHQAIEGMAHCNMKQAVFILSLREDVETGKGILSLHNLKIDNRNEK